MSKNDITGDTLKTKFGSKTEIENYSSGYDLIFGKKDKDKDKIKDKKDDEITGNAKSTESSKRA